MKADKPDRPSRNVAGMQVLSDIRGLLSETRVEVKPVEAPMAKKAGPDVTIARLQKEIASYKEQARKQQAELDRLKTERDALAARLNAAAPGKDTVHQPAQAGQRLGDEVSDLERRKEELSSALAEIEGMLQVKTQDLLRRLANLYEDAGQSEFAQELRRGRNGLQNPENLASFLRAFLRQ